MAEKEITNKKKPNFVVKESKFSARVKARWRYPRGMHSKVRQKHKGRPSLPSTGYGAPRETRGKHESGLEIVRVHNSEELSLLNKGNQGAIISGTVGKRKKLVLLQLAKEKGIQIFNVKDIDNQIKLINEGLAQRKKVKTEKLKEKDKKKEEKKKKAEEKKKKEEDEKKKPEVTEDKVDEKQKTEQKEIEKTIIKRQ
tara:strand:- start:765 stop:1355 length:591 start_codon:yes stop_codon:yes gene_type:complete